MHNSGILNTNKDHQLLLTTLSNKRLTVIFFIFTGLVALSMLIVSTAPDTWGTSYKQIKSCGVDVTPFGGDCQGVNVLASNTHIFVQSATVSAFNQAIRFDVSFLRNAQKQSQSCLSSWIRYLPA